MTYVENKYFSGRTLRYPNNFILLSFKIVLPLLVLETILLKKIIVLAYLLTFCSIK